MRRSQSLRPRGGVAYEAQALELEREGVKAQPDQKHKEAANFLSTKFFTSDVYSD